MSALRERRKLRHLAASSGNSDVATDYGRSAWLDSFASNAFPLVATLVLVWLATVALVFVNQFVQLDFVPLVYMLPVVVAAIRWGVVPGVVAAIAGVAAADFFFYPPLYSFRLSNPQDVVHLALFLLVAIVISNLAARLKHLEAKESIEQAATDGQTEILRDALMGSVSHDLRTPLASILGSCSVLGEMPGVCNDSRSHALVEGIQDQAGRLDDEIRLLLDATRLSAKGILPQKVWTDPTDIIDGAVKQKKRALASHRIVFDVMREPPLIHVDPVLVEQAFSQLLENAAKYSPAGTGIKIGSNCADGYLELSVTDHGSGMTAEEMSKLGTHCFRNPRHAGAASGFGLGLWIASTFVSANAGTLHAESQGPNLGTTVSLRLPIASTDTPEFVEASNA